MASQSMLEPSANSMRSMRYCALEKAFSKVSWSPVRLPSPSSMYTRIWPLLERVIVMFALVNPFTKDQLITAANVVDDVLTITDIEHIAVLTIMSLQGVIAPCPLGRCFDSHHMLTSCHSLGLTTRCRYLRPQSGCCDIALPQGYRPLHRHLECHCRYSPPVNHHPLSRARYRCGLCL